VKSSDADIIFGVPENNQMTDVPLSIPYFGTESVLFLNSSVDPNELDNKKYAAMRGLLLPKGIREENTIYLIHGKPVWTRWKAERPIMATGMPIRLLSIPCKTATETS